MTISSGLCGQISDSLLTQPLSGLMGLAWQALLSSGAMPFWQAQVRGQRVRWATHTLFLPHFQDETYDRTLLCIDEENREYAQRLFRCLALSIRPLRIEELAEILTIQSHEKALPTFNTDWRPANAEEAIMSVCSSLIVIVDRGGHQVVQFSHLSVKEYLTLERLAAAEEHLLYYHIIAHTILAQASLASFFTSMTKSTEIR